VPIFLLYFGLACIAGMFIAFSISQLPYGIGTMVRELLACLTAALVFGLLISILHSLIKIIVLLST